ncbi:hypothetical protein AB6A40_001245 [Gnathostoma spinigerum]|uniref:ENTH domain-containing protein n=1 Tax=Gnathostoma spinigerum TaxID=75299 RepID=A0ABD6E5Y6_9BILA
MQTIEKALHQPMPFTTGGQTITDRLTAAKHSLAGSQLGKTICKATTEELMAPKKKHLDYLLHCTNEPNVSIPSMANLLIERTQNPNWTVVYKALITIHNIMCYGNERFSQYLASCNTTFNLGGFLDKNSTQGNPYVVHQYTNSRNWASMDSVFVGYDMSQHVRRYGKYISEKIYTYRLCAYDFCKVKRGREDGLLRTMSTDKLLKTLPILQNQIDVLLEFQVKSDDLNNGVINCSFILLFRDLIRLFACYNDGIINLLEKYFDMNKKQCREALNMYKAFLLRLDKVAEFLRVAESVGIDRGEIPDLTRAPASLLEALETHLAHLEGGRAPPASDHSQQIAAAMSQSSGLFSSDRHQIPLDDATKQKYIEEEKERLRMFEEQRKKQLEAQSNEVNASSSGASFNPFSGETTISQGPDTKTSEGRPSDDLLGLFDPVPASMPPHPPIPPQPMLSHMSTVQQPLMPLDSTNPFAQSIFQQQQHSEMFGVPQTAASAFPPVSQQSASTKPFGTDFSNVFGGMPTSSAAVTAASSHPAEGTNPFLISGGAVGEPEAQMMQQRWGSSLDNTLPSAHWDSAVVSSMPAEQPPKQWTPITQMEFSQSVQPQRGSITASGIDWGAGAVGAASVRGADSSDSGDEAGATPRNVVPTEAVSAAIRNPFSALQQNAQALHLAGGGAGGPPGVSFQAPPSANSSVNASPVPFNVPQSAPQTIPQNSQNLGIYEQTPFSRMDGSYTSSPVFPRANAEDTMVHGSHSGEAQSTLDGFPNQQQQQATLTTASVQSANSAHGKFGGNDLDSALSSLADNLSIGAKAGSQTKPVQWNTQGVRPALISQTPTQLPFSQMPQQWPAMGAYPPHPAMYGQQPVMNIYGQPGYGQIPQGYGVPSNPTQPQPQQPQSSQPPNQQDPFGF